MSNKLLAAVAATTLAAPLLLAGPAALAGGPAAQAADRTPSVRGVSDPRGDVWFMSDSEGAKPRRAAHRRADDITSFRVAHQHHRVNLRLEVARLPKHRDIFGGFVTLKGPNGKEYVASTIVIGGPSRGTHDLWGPSGDEIRCPGMTHRIDYRKGVYTMSVPRSCLGSPRWVRARAASSWMGSRGGSYYDIAPGKGANENGPWLPRAWRAAG